VITAAIKGQDFKSYNNITYYIKIHALSSVKNATKNNKNL
jgi:hypothetical protein